MEEPVNKDQLRAELERQAQRYKDVYGGEVTLYAAQRTGKDRQGLASTRRALTQRLPSSDPSKPRTSCRPSWLAA